jgi:hypothetical protein
MPSIEQLGRETKRECPGEYDDYSDYDVGMALKKRYPGRYDEYTNASTNASASALSVRPPVLSVEAFQTDTTPLMKVDTRVEDRVQGIINYFNPRRGLFVNWIKRIRSGSANRLLEVTTETERLVILQGSIIQEAVIQGRKNDIDFRVYCAQNAETLLSIQHKATLIEGAMAVGLPLDLAAQWRLEELQSQAKIKEHREMSAIDLENRKKNIDQDFEAAMRFYIATHDVVDELTLKLHQRLLQKEKIKAGSDSNAVKKQMIAQLDDNIRSLRTQINVRNGLVLSDDRSEAGRPGEAPSNRGTDD